MRIIAGSLKGRRLVPLSEDGVRPTPDRLRQSIFNILGQNMQDLDFLDLYAGSGAMGLEAASRGARRVVLVERDPRTCAACRANIEHLGVGRVVQLECSDVDSALAVLARAGDRFDIVFADPPYSDPPARYQALVDAVASGGILAPDGCLVLQRKRGGPVPAHPALTLSRERTYGITTVMVLDRSVL